MLFIRFFPIYFPLTSVYCLPYPLELNAIAGLTSPVTPQGSSTRYEVENQAFTEIFHGQEVFAIPFLQALRSPRVKHGKFTQRQPLCNIPYVFWSRLSRIRVCTLSFRYFMLLVDVRHNSIHTLTEGENVCPNEQQHKGLYCWMCRKLLQVSGTCFPTVSFSSSFLREIAVIHVIAVTLQSLPSQSRQGWAGFLLLPEQYRFHSSLIAVFVYNSTAHLCCCQLWPAVHSLLFLLILARPTVGTVFPSLQAQTKSARCSGEWSMGTRPRRRPLASCLTRIRSSRNLAMMLWWSTRTCHPTKLTSGTSSRTSRWACTTRYVERFLLVGIRAVCLLEGCGLKEVVNGAEQSVWWGSEKSKSTLLNERGNDLPSS